MAYASGVNRWWRAVLQLAAFLSGVALATSRLGLVLHEFVGHGGTAVACGGELLQVKLFWFAGGWIRYRVPHMTAAEDLAITLGGIALECVLGTVLWLALRRRSLAGRVGRALGATMIVHAMFYLAAGTWHGYGDGRAIHEALGDGRYPVAIAAMLVGSLFGWLGARHLFGAILSVLPERRLAGALIAIGLAGTLNAALAIGEVRMRRDTTYSVIMQPERERIVAQELADWERLHAEADAAGRAARERELAAQHKDFPFAWLCGAAMLAAVVIGAARSRQPDDITLRGRAVAIAVGVAVISTAGVIALDCALH
jgi:hypothetical protein